MNIPKKHHYNPILLLKEFCADNSRKLFIYDLDKGEIRESVPEKIACETNFYSLFNNGEIDTRLELLFSKIESEALPAIENFKNSVPLSTKEKEDFAKFIALMGIRTPTFINNMALHKTTREDFASFEKEQSPEFTQPRIKEIARDIVLQESFIWEYWHHLENKILDMKWSLFKAAPGKRFITSDNPLCYILEPSDHNRDGIDIFLALQDPSLLLYLPLSKGYCWLGHWSNNNDVQYEADNEWMKMFERNCVLWADKCLYASTNDKNILKHAMEYRQKPFGVTTPQSQSGFIIPEIDVKRARPQ